MDTWIARKWITPLWRASGSRASVIVKHRFPGGRTVGGKYNMDEHTVTLYLNEIRKQCRLLFGRATMPKCVQLLQIVFAHELGHAEDSRLAELSERMDSCGTELDRSRLALEIEENAWNYARELLPASCLEMLEIVAEHSLRAYHEAIAAEQARQDIA